MRPAGDHAVKGEPRGAASPIGAVKFPSVSKRSAIMDQDMAVRRGIRACAVADMDKACPKRQGFRRKGLIGEGCRSETRGGEKAGENKAMHLGSYALNIGYFDRQDILFLMQIQLAGQGILEKFECAGRASRIE